MGKRRIIAETGAGQHGVAAATACALLDLECIVYMGTEDMRRQRPNVERMGLLGARRRARRGGRADAEGGGLGGDPRLGHERRDHALHHRLVRRAGAVPGAGPRPPAGDRRRGPRAGARARRPAAPARDRVRRRRLELDRHVHAVRRRPRGRAGRRRGRRRGDRDRAPRGSVDGRRSARRAPRRVLGDHAGRGRPDPRGALDLGRPRLSGDRARARVAAGQRPRRATSRSPTDRRSRRSH